MLKQFENKDDLKKVLRGHILNVLTYFFIYLVINIVVFYLSFKTSTGVSNTTLVKLRGGFNIPINLSLPLFFLFFYTVMIREHFISIFSLLKSFNLLNRIDKIDQKFSWSLVDTSLLFGGGKFAKTSQNVKALIVGIGSELVEIKPFFASKKFR